MQPGIWTSYLFDLSPEEMVVTFAERGWPLLELSDEHGAALLERGAPTAAGERFKAFAGDRGVSFPQGHLWLKCDIAAMNQAGTLDRLRSWLDLFVAVGVRAAVLHPGGREMREGGSSPAEIHEARVHALNVLTDHLRGTDMDLCLENMADTQDAQPLLDLIRAAGGSHLGICLDTGHLNLAGGDQAVFVRQAGPHLKALHIADNEGKTDQHTMPYGRGSVDWSGLIDALREASCRALFNLEIPGENRCPRPVRLAKLDYLKIVLEIMLDETA